MRACRGGHGRRGHRAIVAAVCPNNIFFASSDITWLSLISRARS